MKLTGIHHLTAVSADAPGNHAFYTQALGMRLVKKTVNQDDVSAYHLFYADGVASPGSDLTFFDLPYQRERRGTNSIARTALRVQGESTPEWWKDRFEAARESLMKIWSSGTDASGSILKIRKASVSAWCDDGGVGEALPWDRSPVPPEHQIRGLGPITMSVPRPGADRLVSR